MDAYRRTNKMPKKQ